MEFSQEPQAPSTELSQQLPQIPPTPPIPNSSPLFASPSLPSNPEPQSKTIVSRQILKPVAPSKRPVTERPTQKGIEKLDTQNAFLPKELADIIATRQRRERAWHTRLLILACNGYKKARVVVGEKTQAILSTKASQRQSPTSKTVTSGSDKRLFVRLPQENEWRKLPPAELREVLVRKLMISPSLIGRIKPVHSGFALSPCSVEARESILKVGNGLFLTEAKLESATSWAPIIIPTLPLTIRKEQDM
ncbi:putative eka-like protein [Erysiphe necator]|uniref:Putative eka-like protein n=1 Tax=Uncinula necator TaxID=52586 RepID=A0A0B1NVD3_UNCNE|nr:putative eka-like protein [Erysiphe necator]